MLIVLIGPDGCGKTTVANELAAKTETLGFGGSAIYECNFRILPTLTQVRARLSIGSSTRKQEDPENNGSFLSGMRISPSKKPKAFLVFFWYLADYIIGHFRVMLGNQRNELIIFGRYYYDFLFQRAHRALPGRLVKAFGCVVPKPDYIVFLKRDPAVVYSQKPELTIKEIQYQNEVIERELSDVKGFAVIIADKGIDDVVQQVSSLINRKRVQR